MIGLRSFPDVYFTTGQEPAGEMETLEKDFKLREGVSARGSSTAGGNFCGCFDLLDLLVFPRRSFLVAFRTFFDCLVFLTFFDCLVFLRLLAAICLTPL